MTTLTNESPRAVVLKHTCPGVALCNSADVTVLPGETAEWDKSRFGDILWAGTNEPAPIAATREQNIRVLPERIARRADPPMSKEVHVEITRKMRRIREDIRDLSNFAHDNYQTVLAHELHRLANRITDLIPVNGKVVKPMS